MATNAAVAIELANGKVMSIYNHSDGYPEHLGKVLVQHYQDPAKVAELIKNGDASFIDENIGEKINFNDYDTREANKQCLFYGRDRGETGVAPQTYNDYKQWASSVLGDYSYAYIFDTKTNTWAGYNGDKEITLPGNPGLTRTNDVVDTHNKLG